MDFLVNNPYPARIFGRSVWHSFKTFSREIFQTLNLFLSYNQKEQNTVASSSLEHAALGKVVFVLKRFMFFSVPCKSNPNLLHEGNHKQLTGAGWAVLTLKANSRFQLGPYLCISVMWPPRHHPHPPPRNLLAPELARNLHLSIVSGSDLVWPCRGLGICVCSSEPSSFTMALG